MNESALLSIHNVGHLQLGVVVLLDKHMCIAIHIRGQVDMYDI
jgi:hypothetical protein